MKRTTKTVFTSDSGRELVVLSDSKKAAVAVFSCDAEELLELAEACREAAQVLTDAALSADEVSVVIETKQEV